MSARAIAYMCGVNDHTVSSIADQLRILRSPEEKLIGRDGIERPARREPKQETTTERAV